MASPYDEFQQPAKGNDPYAEFQRPASSAAPAEEKPWIGTAPPKDEGMLSSIFHAPAYGVQDIGAGVKHLMTPGKRMQGAHEVISGTGRAAIPFIAPAIAAYGAGPVALGLGGSMIGSTIGKTGASMLGANEDVSNLAGDAGAIAGGMGAPRIPFKSIAGKALDFAPETDAGIRDVVGMASPRLARGLGVLQRAKDARAVYQNAQPPSISSAPQSNNPIVFGEQDAFSKLPPHVQDAILKGQSHAPQPTSTTGPMEPRPDEHYGIASPKPAPSGAIPVPEPTVKGAINKLDVEPHEPYSSYSPSRVERQMTPAETTPERAEYEARVGRLKRAFPLESDQQIRQRADRAIIDKKLNAAGLKKQDFQSMGGQ